MSSLAVFIWIVNIVCDTIGHIALKYAAILDHETELGRWKAMLTSLPLWIGVVCFCLEFLVWLAFLSVLSLSQGVLLGAINMVAIVIAGKLLFKERLDRMRVIGVGLISLGVALVGIFA